MLLAHHVGARLHVCHVSTAGAVDVIRWAKARGIAVTAEVTPHHLLLTEESVRGYDGRFKVNPPLRADEDVQALRAGLADGTIDIIATDHAPHPREAKECEWDAAAFGMVGLESALSVVQAAVVDTGVIGWADVARVLSSAPAGIGQLAGYDSGIVAGATEFTLYDPRGSFALRRDQAARQGTQLSVPRGEPAGQGHRHRPPRISDGARWEPRRSRNRRSRCRSAAWNRSTAWIEHYRSSSSPY